MCVDMCVDLCIGIFAGMCVGMGVSMGLRHGCIVVAIGKIVGMIGAIIGCLLFLPWPEVTVLVPVGSEPAPRFLPAAVPATSSPVVITAVTVGYNSYNYNGY